MLTSGPMHLSKRLKAAGGLLAGVSLLMHPAAAHADAGIPMLPVRYPAILLFMVPVIVIETVYLQRQLQTRWRRTSVAVTVINLCTTALGYPLAWALYQLLDRAIGFPRQGSGVFESMGWLPVWVCTKVYPQWAGVRTELWPVLVLFGILLLPSFILSGVVKRALLQSYDLLNYRGSTGEEAWAATRLSYLFLVGSGCAVLYLTYTRM